LRLDPVDLSTVPDLAGATGRLAMTSLPGGPRPTGGERHGDLDEDARILQASGATDLVLLVEDRELVLYGTSRIVDAMAAVGIVVLRHPIPDLGTPVDAEAFAAVLDDVLGRLRAGRSVVVACLAGHGRTGMFVACLLVAAGLAPDDAIALTRASRPGTIETAAQLHYVGAPSPRGRRPR
jgi:protein-tyrosine phosphatase